MGNKTVSDSGTITDSWKAYRLVESFHSDPGCETVSAILLDSFSRAIGITHCNGGLSQGLGNVYDNAATDDKCDGVIVGFSGQLIRCIEDYVPSVIDIRTALNTCGRKLIDVIICNSDGYFSFADNVKHSANI